METMEERICQKSNSKKKGFTLLEVMFGISLFAMALFPIMMVLAQSLTFGSYANNRAIAMNEARRVVEDIRRVADTSGLNALIGKSWSGTVLPSETISVTDLFNNLLQNNADPLPIRATIVWTEKGKTTSYRVETMVTDR